MAEINVPQEVLCVHCGADCPDGSPLLADKTFCCNGCKAVYELLHSSGMTAYYFKTENPGIKPAQILSGRFDYLDNPELKRKLIAFSDGSISRMQLSIPQMHCVSCIWLLEHLSRINQGIVQSQVDFPHRTLTVVFKEAEVSLKAVVELLAHLGYEPLIRMGDLHEKPETRKDYSLYLKIGIAGFAFGNIMLLSFPEYLRFGDIHDPLLAKVFRYGSLILATPVLLYSAQDYFISALRGLRNRTVTIELPIILGMLALFGRSLYEIIFEIGPGYFDSFCGFVFFLLLGRLLQQQTYQRLSFERDYQAYFPVAVTRKLDNNQISIPVTELKVGDRIVIRNQELIPSDSVVINGTGNIDYSFVTGESETKVAESGVMVYAGGRQSGSSIELEVVREVSQSYLTSLWNSEVFKKQKQESFSTIINRAGKYFTVAVLLISALTAFYWLSVEPSRTAWVITSVLIVACPCALALSGPFAFGTAQRIFGHNKLYLKNSSSVETMAEIDSIVFDKTGTLMETYRSGMYFDGPPLTDYEQQLVVSLASQSNHPISRKLAGVNSSNETQPVCDFAEMSGNGIAGVINGREIRIGRYGWVISGSTLNESHNQINTGTYLSIDNSLRGRFVVTGVYREGVIESVAELRDNFKLALLTGDNPSELKKLQTIFGNNSDLQFEQSPYDKLSYVTNLQNGNQRVMMIGDGLNDAGALKASDIGIAVTENSSSFSPACDGILDAQSLCKLQKFIRLAKGTRHIVLASFIISALYNVIGLGYAVTGHLSPLVSAILMPLSSISVVVFAVLGTRVQARRAGL